MKYANARTMPPIASYSFVVGMIFAEARTDSNMSLKDFRLGDVRFIIKNFKNKKFFFLQKISISNLENLTISKAWLS